MNRYLILCTLLAALGAGVMAGFFYTFSNAVMGALGRIEKPAGIAAMQSINVVVLNPLFFALFFGTALLSLVLVAAPLLGGGGTGTPAGAGGAGAAAAWLGLAGGLVYLVTVIGVTIAFNVPMNDRLANVAADSPAGAELWTDYLRRWTRWNHVRALGGTVAFALFLAAVLAG